MLNPLEVETARDLREAQRFCERLARREAKNFYWGFISLPHEQRVAIFALYGFARHIDDEADDPQREHRAERLDVHRARVSRAMRGEYDDPVTQVLADAVRRYQIPEAELQLLIDGVATDLTRSRYDTWDELRVYCNAVASVVGRMCVRVFGFDDPVALERADDLGLALQLTNILRDVREDAAMGRIYLPAEDLARFGVSVDDVIAGTPGSGWEELVAFEVARAEKLFASGYRVLAHIPRRPAACVQTMAGIYHRILEKIERDPRLPLRERASLTRAEKLGVLVRSWFRGA